MKADDELAALGRIKQRFGLGPVTDAERARARVAGTPVEAEADRLYSLAQRFRLGVDWAACLRAATTLGLGVSDAEKI